MDEVGAAVIKAAYEIYDGYIKEGMNSGKYPPYKASGMAYIRFAREKRNCSGCCLCATVPMNRALTTATT